MIPFWPEPYPDELTYSIFARYHYLSCNISYKDTIHDLFGSKTACAVMDLPNRLQKLCEQLPDGSTITADSIIQKNTLFPLFQPFLPNERVIQIIRMMKGSKKGGKIHTTSGIMASGISSPRYLRICPKCVTEDEERYGEAYWHRAHQVSGVFLCFYHHTWLLESNIAVSCPMNKHVFKLLTRDSIEKVIKPEDGDNLFNRYFKVAEAVHWFLNNSVDPPGLVAIKKRYVAYLLKRDLATYSGRIRQNEVIDEFTAFFGSGFLQNVKSKVDYGQDNWLSKLLREPRTSTHPLRHILLMIFLGVSPEEFFKKPKLKFNPFGNGPWPCLNPASRHYHHNEIKEVHISMDSKLKVPVGNFRCTCGFAYSRRGPDMKESDRYRIGRIKSFGPVWLEKLSSLSSESCLSLREIARQLNVDPGTIKNQLQKINTPMVAKKIDEYLILKEKYRSYWLRVFLSNPKMGRKELRYLAYAEYVWLYRHDREWLNEHLPSRKNQRKLIFKRVDWGKRDLELSEQVFSAAFKLKSKAGRPIRLTISLIGKEIGQQMLLEKHLAKLPETKAIFEKIIESKEEFQCRRVRYTIEKIKKDGEPLMVWKVIRKAGLRPGFSPRVASEIMNFIDKEMSLQ